MTRAKKRNKETAKRTRRRLRRKAHPWLATASIKFDFDVAGDMLAEIGLLDRLLIENRPAVEAALEQFVARAIRAYYNRFLGEDARPDSTYPTDRLSLLHKLRNGAKT